LMVHLSSPGPATLTRTIWTAGLTALAIVALVQTVEGQGRKASKSPSVSRSVSRLASPSASPSLLWDNTRIRWEWNQRVGDPVTSWTIRFGTEPGVYPGESVIEDRKVLEVDLADFLTESGTYYIVVVGHVHDGDGTSSEVRVTFTAPDDLPSESPSPWSGASPSVAVSPFVSPSSVSPGALQTSSDSASPSGDSSVGQSQWGSFSPYLSPWSNPSPSSDVIPSVAPLDSESLSGSAGHRGPRDWSHDRFVVTGDGQTLTTRSAAEWRTARRLRMREAARNRRALALERLLDDRWQGRDTSSDGDDSDVADDSDVTDDSDDSYPTTQSSSAGTKLDWLLRTGGYGSVIGSPAKYSWDITTFNCADVIYFTVNQRGRTTAQRAVNVIGITQPYAGCLNNSTGQTPTVKFGIALPYGTATSPVLSLDGEVLYVMQSRPSANGGPILHAINVNNITNNPGAYNFTTRLWTQVHTLAAPSTPAATSEQLFQITFSGITNAVSSPFLDYDGDQIFFGDSAGRIRRVRNVSTAAAAQDTTNFPRTCGNSALQPPVFYDDQIIATSANGRLYRIDMSGSAPYSCVSAEQVGSGSTPQGGVSAPIIDVTNSMILVVTNDAEAYGVRAIGSFRLKFTSGESYVSGAYLGPESDTAPESPTFDEAFWSTNDGNVYAVGGPDSGNGTLLFRIPYNGVAFGLTAGYATLRRTGSAATVPTTPVLEFLTASPTTPDFVFVGGGGGTYLFMNRIPAGFNGTMTSPVAMAGAFAVTGGVTSGIIIDTRTTAMTGLTATANIYFGTMGVGTTTQSNIIQVAQAF